MRNEMLQKLINMDYQFISTIGGWKTSFFIYNPRKEKYYKNPNNAKIAYAKLFSLIQISNTNGLPSLYQIIPSFFIFSRTALFI